ncbi:IS3 family transposase, partial [Listeria seeligeri]
MYWQKRLEQKNPNALLEKKIQEIFDEHHGNYGYRRIHLALKAQGIMVNQKKVRRIMGKLGLKGSKFIRKSRRYNSYKGPIGRVAKNRIHRRFYTSIP